MIEHCRDPRPFKQLRADDMRVRASNASLLTLPHHPWRRSKTLTPKHLRRLPFPPLPSPLPPSLFSSKRIKCVCAERSCVSPSASLLLIKAYCDSCLHANVYASKCLTGSNLCILSVICFGVLIRLQARQTS